MQEQVSLFDDLQWPSGNELQTLTGWRVQYTPTLVNNYEALDALVDKLKAAPYFAYDTETSGLKPSLGARAIGHCFALRSAESTIDAYYVPVRHIGSANVRETQLDPEQVAKRLQVAFSSPGEIVGHNLKFDLLMARADGLITQRNVHDTAICATVDNENEPSFKLKSLADKYTLRDASSAEDVLENWMKKDARALKLNYKKRSHPNEMTYLERFGYSRTPIKLCGPYGCLDAFYTLHLWLTRYAVLWSKFPAVMTREHRVSKILHDMEWRGLPANRDEIVRAAALAESEEARLLEECKQLTGDPEFALGSAYLSKLMFEKLGMKVPKKTKSGGASTDRETRLLLIEEYPQHAPLLHAIDRLSEASKIRNTYAHSFLKHFSEQTCSIHPSYNQLEARDEGGVPVTGRLSSSDPNCQNVASKPLHLQICKCKKCSPAAVGDAATISIRRYFTVPRGYVRVYIDFSQIELRVLAWFSRDESLLECYSKDLDVHQMTADDVTDGDRKIAKAVNFGNSYGMSNMGLAKRMPGYYKDPDGTRERAKIVLERYFQKYHGILRFRRTFATNMRRQGNMFINPFGRPRRIPLLSSPKSWERDRAERMMMSSIISGTAADIMKESLIRCADILAVESPESYIAQTIHDELVFDLRATPGWTGVMLKLKSAMEDWPQFEQQGVPIRTSMELSITNWEDKRKIEVVDGGFRFAA